MLYNVLSTNSMLQLLYELSNTAKLQKILEGKHVQGSDYIVVPLIRPLAKNKINVVSVEHSKKCNLKHADGFRGSRSRL